MLTNDEDVKVNMEIRTVICMNKLCACASAAICIRMSTNNNITQILNENAVEVVTLWLFNFSFSYYELFRMFDGFK